jgi:succinylglutamate desuccinylase
MKIERDLSIPNVVRIEADSSGPRAVIFSGIHGDELSGIHAVEKLFFDLFVGSRELSRGTLTMVRGNRDAMTAERRYLKYNLNRMFKDDYPQDVDRSSYEFKRAQELKKLLEKCDYFFDLHSAPFAQAPFIVAEEKAIPFFSRLGIPKIMTGWSKFSAGAIGGDTENYANAHGAISATLESGSHFDKRSNDIAYRSVLSFLTLLEMIPGEVAAEAPLEIVDVYSVVLKEADDFRFSGVVDNFRPLAKGEAFAVQGGRNLTVDEDSYLLIPMKPEETRIGEEVCYLGRRIDGPRV